MGKLSDTQLKAWVRAGKAIAGKSDGGGLTFTLSKAGAAAWVLRYRHGGRQREFTIGKYPDTTLADARITASELRGRVQKGEDIAASKQAQKAIDALDINIFESLACEWMDRGMAESMRAKTKATFKRYVFPSIGKLPPNDIHPQHIDKILRNIVAAGSPTVSNDVLRYLKRLFSYARKRRIVSDNPAADFDYGDAGGKESSRDRALSLKEIKTLLKAMSVAPTLGRDNELAFKLLLLLGVRKAELLTAPWSEFDLDAGIWRLPENRTKTTQAVDIPLPPLAIKLFQELKVRAAGSVWVFPARRISTRKLGHISTDTLNLAQTRINHGLKHFTIHDLRRTVRTQLAALGITPHIAERVLNHKLQGVEGVYDQYDYIKERRQALEQWADVLESLEGDGNVIPIGNKVAQ